MAAATAGAIAAAVIGGGASIAASNADRKQAEKAFDTQTSQNASNADFLSKQANIGSSQAEALFGAAGKNRIRAGREALKIFGETMPQQLRTFQEGNVGAQQQLLAGLPQIQNALLGRQVDLSGLQPTNINVDTGFTQRTLPAFTSASTALQSADLSRVLPNNKNLVGSGFFDLPQQSDAPELGGFGSTFKPFG